MNYISGQILTERGFSKGYLCIDNNEIIEQRKGNPPSSPICKGIITPLLCNMHTHIGDTFIRFQNISLPHDIVKLVAPPDGLKYQMLSSTKQNDILQGMRKAIKEMESNGIGCFCDFRENGIDGIKLINKATMNSHINSCILSRPKTLEYKPSEISSLLKNSDGIAISSLEEWDFDELYCIVQQVKRAHKLFSLHVSERIREEIKKVLSLQPDFVIHMTKASKNDLQQMKKNNIPIVICPRSSSFFHNDIPLKTMKDTGNTLLVGTDNGMLHSSNIMEEIQFVQKQYPSIGGMCRIELSVCRCLLAIVLQKLMLLLGV